MHDSQEAKAEVLVAIAGRNAQSFGEGSHVQVSAGFVGPGAVGRSD